MAAKGVGLKLDAPEGYDSAMSAEYLFQVEPAK
jgi:hypothetical protein